MSKLCSYSCRVLYQWGHALRIGLELEPQFTSMNVYLTHDVNVAYSCFDMLSVITGMIMVLCNPWM